MVFQELIAEIDNINLDDFIKKDIAVLHFFSDWQMNCLMSLPIIENLAEEFAGKISFGNVNIEEAEEVAQKHEIESVPTLMIFKNGQVIAKLKNNFSEEELREKLCVYINR